HANHAVVSIRSFTKDSFFRMGEVIGIDPEMHRVFYRIAGTDTVNSMGYDHLVVSLGSVTMLPKIAGLREYGFQIKSLAHAVGLRDRAIRLLETADAIPDKEQQQAMLHWVVVGGNFTGVEVAGEFQVLLRKACRSYPNIDPQDCKVTLVEIADRILPALGEDLSDYALKKLRSRKIDVRLNTTIKAIERERVLLSSGETLSAHTTVWCAGIAPNPLIAEMPFPTDPRGYILCDPDFRIHGFRNLWAVGDCAVNPDPQGNAYPATAQHATRQGTHLARNLLRVATGRESSPFVFNSMGSLAALGCRTGVAKIMGIKLSGFAAWFMWRTVYLLTMPGITRKVRVAIDWALDLLFKRDFVQLGLLEEAMPRTREAQPPQPNSFVEKKPREHADTLKNRV
ncbi:MAG: NAD(P)/FAD-dependent oxidoreductase, partial [Planctomycetota bacterium]